MIYQQYRRRVLRLTQHQLADRAGVSRDVVGDVERGRVNPRLDELAKIARVLGVDPPERLLTHVADPFEHDQPEPRS